VAGLVLMLLVLVLLVLVWMWGCSSGLAAWPRPGRPVRRRCQPPAF